MIRERETTNFRKEFEKMDKKINKIMRKSKWSADEESAILYWMDHRLEFETASIIKDSNHKVVIEI